MEKKLLELGFKPTKGLYYLAKAVEIRMKDNDIRTCEIYYEVADTFNSTKSRVERCMRHCIRTSNTKYKDMHVGMAINALSIELK